MHKLWELVYFFLEHVLRVVIKVLVSEIFRHWKHMKLKASSFMSQICVVCKDCNKLVCLKC